MKQLAIVFLFLISFSINAQVVKGNLTKHAKQQITLTGFNYYETFTLSKSTIDSLGNFELVYPSTYKGMAILKTQDNGSLIITLTEPDIILKGTHLRESDSLQYINSFDNKKFSTVAKNYARRQQVYKAWRYLQPKYEKATPLNKQKKTLKAIDKEIARIEQADKNIASHFSIGSYLNWFVYMRKLVNEMPATVYSYPERIPKNIKEFRSIDFMNPNFKTSGLFKELIEGHYLLLENMGKSLPDMYVEMNISTDYLLNNLKEDKELLNKLAKKLFAYFEKRSLFKAAAHLSEVLVDEKYHSITDVELAKTFQKYVNLKVGNTAPDIQLDNNTKLSSYNNNVLLVFGKSDCPACKKDALKLLNYYDTWKSKKKLEVVYISLDGDEKTFKEAFKNAPWPSFSDFKGWNGDAVKKYYVNATPTYLLLDKDLKILVHPRSIEQVNTWVDYKL